MPSSTPSQLTLFQRLYPNLRLSPCTVFRIAGILPIVLVLALQFLAYITAVPGTLLPLYSLYPILSSFLLLLFHYFFLNTLFNYLLLVIVDPGTVPEDWHAPPPPPPTSYRKPLTEEQITLLRSQYPPFPHAHLMQERLHSGQLRYCHICKAYKPDRAHHCSVCRRCILRMDHHCIFINNCVAHGNHKFFLSFVINAFLGCLQITIVSLPTFLQILSITPTSSIPHHAKWNPLHLMSQFTVRFSVSQFSTASHISLKLQTIVMVGYITTSAFSFALSIFVMMHIYLLVKGRTTIEMYELTDPVRAPQIIAYDLGAKRNFRHVCGPVPLCWLLPTRAYVEGDGLHYETSALSARPTFEV